MLINDLKICFSLCVAKWWTIFIFWYPWNHEFLYIICLLIFLLMTFNQFLASLHSVWHSRTYFSWGWSWSAPWQDWYPCFFSEKNVWFASPLTLHNILFEPRCSCDFAHVFTYILTFIFTYSFNHIFVWTCSTSTSRHEMSYHQQKSLRFRGGRWNSYGGNAIGGMLEWSWGDKYK